MEVLIAEESNIHCIGIELIAIVAPLQGWLKKLDSVSL